MEGSVISLEAALTVLGMAFGAWAAVVAWGVQVIRQEVRDMKAAAKGTSDSLTSHVNQTERRLTMLESEWRWLKDWFIDIRNRTNNHGGKEL